MNSKFIKGVDKQYEVLKSLQKKELLTLKTKQLEKLKQLDKNLEMARGRESGDSEEIKYITKNIGFCEDDEWDELQNSHEKSKKTI